MPAAPKDRRHELVSLLAPSAIAERSAPVSLRQFAIKAGVSEPTLRHFFTDRQGVVIALIGYFAEGARQFLELSAKPEATLKDAVSGYGELALAGAQSRLFAQAHAFALVESIHDPAVARAYLQTIIEPSLQALEQRLAPAMDPDAASPERVRHAALALYAPILIAILHQDLLKGDEVRPLDMSAFITDLTALFTHGLQPKANS
jgi:AcrR family transcriptional regulator